MGDTSKNQDGYCQCSVCREHRAHEKCVHEEKKIHNSKKEEIEANKAQNVKRIQDLLNGKLSTCLFIGVGQSPESPEHERLAMVNFGLRSDLFDAVVAVMEKDKNIRELFVAAVAGYAARQGDVMEAITVSAYLAEIKAKK